MSRYQEALALLRGLQIILNVARKHNQSYIKHVWSNSSIREILERNLSQTKTCASDISADPSKQLQALQNILKETVERSAVVMQGLPHLASAKINPLVVNKQILLPITQQEATPTKSDVNLDISSITLNELEQILTQRNKNREVSLRLKNTKTLPQVEEVKEEPNKKVSHQPETKAEIEENETYVENVLRAIAGKGARAPEDAPPPIETPELSNVAKQRKVPSSRLGRMTSFGQLFAGLGVGTLNELAKGTLGLGGSKDVKQALLSPANIQRIVDTLCKVRGAALKIGQILSIQDSNIVSPQLAKAFERVRQAADYMPDWQVERVLSSELGSDWEKKFKSFERKPFAAASIGQVHRGVLPDGMEVAIKIQYPGVAKSIESDIDNLIGMLRIWDVFPPGFFIDNLVKVAKRELNWEVDYIREAEYTEKFGEMIKKYPQYYVPKVIKDLTTASVLTIELVPGVPLDKCFEISYEERKFIAYSILELCLRELFELQCMQTDPNWSNFLYDRNSKRIMLIDFGSTRFYSREFIQNYKKIIIAAINDDRKNVLEHSREMGFLTGYESKQMEEAHINAVMILGEMFRYEGQFDFGKQNVTKRIAQLVPTMVAHRLCPPPEEIYSIHRKLSGIFLLCARLNVKMDCCQLYKDIVEKDHNVIRT